MPLTASEQSKIIQVLGYGSKTLQAGSVIYNRVVNDRLHQLLPDAEIQVRSYLASIEALECLMNAAPSRLAASAVDGLKMNLDELQMLRSERKRIAREIAAFLDIPYRATNGPNVGVVS